MNRPIFNFSDNDVAKYERHGIAHAEINQMAPLPISGCQINLEPLVEIEQPSHYWIKQTSQAPTVIFASSKSKGIPESATAFDLDRRLETIIVSYGHTHPKKDYDNVSLEPVYSK